MRAPGAANVRRLGARGARRRCRRRRRPRSAGAACGAPALVLGTVAFAWQIFFDFSGYTDMARGIAKVMGDICALSLMLEAAPRWGLCRLSY